MLRTGSSEELIVEVLHTARTDFASGQPRICYAGTYASSAVGIPCEELGRVSHLKEWPLPSGCTEPLSQRSIRFARIYNEEILRLLVESAINCNAGRLPFPRSFCQSNSTTR